jgi:lysine 2,3-aminomutase
MGATRQESPARPGASGGRGIVCGSPAAPVAEVARRLGVSFDEAVRSAARRLPVRFPESYLALARAGDPEDPIRRIGWPDPEELAPDAGAIADPVGEQSKKLHPLVLRKYPDRALLLLTRRCHFYCRFCFRAGGGADADLDQVEEAVAVLARQRGLREVILSGGDPLVLPDEFLAAVLRRLEALPELTTVRIHTRAPVHDPARVTPELVSTLVSASPRPLWVAIHAAHPRELTSAFERAIGLFLAAGVPLLDQTVLLRGVNADPAVLAQLFRGLYARQVKPLYLHHPDRIAGAARFRVSIEEGLAIYRALRERISGPALPAYVLDLPDGSGKVGVESLSRVHGSLYRGTLPDGRVTEYHDFS